jgi:hypothetical protein
VAFSQTIADERKAKLGPNHPLTLIIMSELSEELRRHGDLTQSERILLSALDSAKSEFSPKGPIVFDFMDSLANLRSRQGE